MRSVAAAHDLHHEAVRYIMNRDVPLFAVGSAETLSNSRPWEADDISRRTWFYRQKTARCTNGE